MKKNFGHFGVLRPTLVYFCPYASCTYCLQYVLRSLVQPVVAPQQSEMDELDSRHEFCLLTLNLKDKGFQIFIHILPQIINLSHCHLFKCWSYKLSFPFKSLEYFFYTLFISLLSCPCFESRLSRPS